MSSTLTSEAPTTTATTPTRKQPHRITLQETREGCQMMEKQPRYNVLLNGRRIGQLYFNLRGYVGTLPLPSGMELHIGECGISHYKKTAAQINRGDIV